MQIGGNQGDRRTKGLCSGPTVRGLDCTQLNSCSTSGTQGTFTPPLSYWPAFFQMIETKSEQICSFIKIHIRAEPVGC